MRRVEVELELPAPGSLLAQFARNTYVICRNVIHLGRIAGLREKALEIARRHARRIEQQTDEHLLNYRVVPGDALATEWPELVSTYRSPELRHWVGAVTGAHAVFPSTHQRSAININVMGEPGEVYRWHKDASGFTLLLYLSNSLEADGGRLELRAPGASSTMTMSPVAGTVVLMDGT